MLSVLPVFSTPGALRVANLLAVSKGIGALAVPCVGQTELPRVLLPGVLTGQVMPCESTLLIRSNLLHHQAVLSKKILG